MRKRKIIELYAQGYGTPEIAQRLAISETPVKQALKRNDVKKRSLKDASILRGKWIKNRIRNGVD